MLYQSNENHRNDRKNAKLTFLELTLLENLGLVHTALLTNNVIMMLE